MRAFTLIFGFFACVLTTRTFANAQSSSSSDGIASAILQGLGQATSSSANTATTRSAFATQSYVYNFTNSTTSSSTTSTTVILTDSSSSSTSGPTSKPIQTSTSASVEANSTTSTVSTISSLVNGTASTSLRASSLSTFTNTNLSNATLSKTSPSSTTAFLNSSSTLNGSSVWQTGTTSQRTVNGSAVWTVPSTGTGAAYASKCNQEWQSYYNISANAIIGSYTSYVSSYVVTNYSAPLTTLCAGNTQVNGPPVPTASFTLPWTTGNSLFPPTITMAATPFCTVPASECGAVGVTSDQYYSIPAGCSSSSTAGSSDISGAGACTIKGSDVQVIYFKPSSTANATQDLCAPSPTAAAAANNDACPYGSFVTSTSTRTTTFTGVTNTATTTYMIDSVTETEALQGSKLYTTVYTETASECVYSSASLGYQNRTASYIVSDGYKYYEDMVYLSFKSVWAVNSAGSTIGTPRAGSLVPMPSSEVYSVCTKQAGQAAYSYNFNDLSGYVPASAWNCQPYCEMVWNEYASGHGGPSQQLPDDTPEGLAAVMPAGPGDFYVNDKLVFAKEGGYCGQFPYQDWYKPYIAVPPQVRALDPAWGSCVLAFEGWYDPPTALTQQTSEILPTSPSAAPASTPQTAAAQTTTQSSTTLSPQPSSSLVSIATQTAVSSDPGVSSTSQSSIASVNLLSAQDPSSSDVNPGVSTSTSSGAAVAASNILSALNPTSASSQQASVSPVSTGGNPTTTSLSSSVAQVAASNILSALSIASTSATGTAQSQANSDPASIQVASSSPGTIQSSANADPASTQAASPSPGTIQPLASTNPTSTRASSSAAPIVASNILSALSVISTTTQQATAIATPSSVAVNSPVIAPSVSVINDPGAGASSQIHTTVNVAGNSVTISQNSASSIAVIDGTTVAQGSQTTVNGQTVSVGSQGVQIGSTYISAAQDPPSTQAAAQVTIGSSAFTVAPIADPTASSAVIVAAGGSTATLTAGQTTNIGGQAVSAPSSGGVVVGQGSSAKTVVVPAISTPSSAASAVITVQGQSVTAIQSGSAVIVAGISSTVVLSEGATGTIDGNAITVASGASALVVGGSTAILSHAPSVTTQAVITGNAGQSITLVQQGQSFSLIGSSSTVVLAAGASTTFQGQTISVPFSTGVANVNGNSVTLSAASSASASVVTQAVFSSNGGQAVTVLQQGSSYEVQVGTSTIHLTAGGITSIAGATISAPTTGSVLLVNGHSTLLSTQAVTSNPVGAVLTGSASQLATIVQSGSSYIVQAGTTTFGLAAGSGTIVNGVTLSVPTGGSAPLANGKTIVLSTQTPTSSLVAALLTGSNSQLATVVHSGSSYLVRAGTTTFGLAAGSGTIVNGITLSIPTGGSAPLANGKTISMSTMSLSSQPAVVTQAALTGVNSKPFTVVQQGSSFLVRDSSSTVTLGAGSQTLFNGATISMLATGGALVANGQTVSLSTVSSLPSTSASYSGLGTFASASSRTSSPSVAATSSSRPEQASGGGRQYGLTVLCLASVLFAMALSIFML
ncbi:hypothetical protein LTR86_004427 [Recurvomyces mirabilis]|nr:hypothetical protein LTR86_004427 [Recurvomyces mirabilis]